LASSPTSKQKVERYSETTIFRIMERYDGIVSAIQDTEKGYMMLKRGGRRDLETLGLTVSRLDAAKAGIDTLTHFYFVIDDTLKVPDWNEVYESAKKRAKAPPKSKEDRYDAYLRAIGGLEVELDAARLWMMKVRDVAAQRNWFALSNRPEQQPHPGAV
jgi:hypothetical protein